MQRRIADIEYEQLMLSRYTAAQYRSQEGIDRSVYLLLSRIDASGPMSIGELSEVFRLDASTLQRQTTAAVRAGFLERILDHDGGVARKFSLTTLGKGQLVAGRERSISALTKVLADWPAADVNQFADLLRRFNTSIEDYSRAQDHSRAQAPGANSQPSP
ncbi:MarR family transcriptional regulator [Specibacter sp. NPDC078692]|uniref:MarR family winged helix-turn-helix transcriptional regulator n=1 Tax=Specibacter sp. NPDC078692 TaxID=3155818 RepID=UPI003447B139